MSKVGQYVYENFHVILAIILSELCAVDLGESTPVHDICCVGALGPPRRRATNAMLPRQNDSLCAGH